MAEVRRDEDVLEDEFDQLAGWTAGIIERLDLADPVPAACNGSGSPASLGWLVDRMRLDSRSLVLDTGAGLGGPAAWLARTSGATLVTSEPMRGAALGSRRLFGTPGVVAWSHQLPFGSGRFAGALALAVLSTVADKEAYLAEVRRVLAPGGRLGLLDYVRTGGPLVDPPVNNEFLQPDQLDRILAASGFEIEGRAMASDLPAAPDEWTTVSDRVSRAVAAAHPGASAVVRAGEQQQRFARLLSAGSLGIRLVTAVRP